MTRLSADEKMKFQHLIKVLVWAKKITKKPSGQVVSAILNHANKDLLSSIKV